MPSLITAFSTAASDTEFLDAGSVRVNGTVGRSVSVRKEQMADHHSTHSTLRERVVEHVFVGEALRTLWRWGVVNVEVLRSEFDAHGYDLVMARRRIVRHIQFKTGTSRRPATFPYPARWQKNRAAA